MFVLAFSLAWLKDRLASGLGARLETRFDLVLGSAQVRILAQLCLNFEVRLVC